MISKSLRGQKRAVRSTRIGQFRAARQRIVVMLAVVVGLAGASTVSAADDRPVEVVSAKKVKSLEWLWSSHDTMTFAPDGTHFLLGEGRPDGYVHLCAYETATLAPLKCLVRLYKSKASYHGSLDWPDDRLFIQAGGFDEAFVGWVNVQGWRESAFKEFDGVKQMQYVKGKLGMSPAWDRKEGGLYYGDSEPIGAIYFEKGGVRTKPFEVGDVAIPGDKYVWYTLLGEHTAALRRLDRATKKVDILSKGDSFGVRALTASPHDHVLFVRAEYSKNPNPRVYAYIEKHGIWGPVYGPANDGEIKFVRISPDGNRALVSVHDGKNSTDGRNRHHIYMLQLHWK